jgi:hypothetical protein
MVHERWGIERKKKMDKTHTQIKLKKVFSSLFESQSISINLINHIMFI